MAQISSVQLPSGSSFGIRAGAIPYGEVDSTSTATAFTVNIPSITELVDGTVCYVRNNVVTSASGFTLNVSGLGAKPVYSSLAAASRVTTLFDVNYTLLFIYNATRVTGGCWDIYYGIDTTDATSAYVGSIDETLHITTGINGGDGVMY